MHISRKFGMIVCNEREEWNTHGPNTLFIKPDGTGILRGRRDYIDWEHDKLTNKARKTPQRNLTKIQVETFMQQRMCPDMQIPKIIMMGFPASKNLMKMYDNSMDEVKAILDSYGVTA